MTPKVGDILIYRDGHLHTEITRVFEEDGEMYISEKSIWVREHDNGGNRLGQKWARISADIIGEYCDISKESRVKNLLDVIDSSEAQTDY